MYPSCHSVRGWVHLGRSTTGLTQWEKKNVLTYSQSTQRTRREPTQAPAEHAKSTQKSLSWQVWAKILLLWGDSAMKSLCACYAFILDAFPFLFNQNNTPEWGLVLGWKRQGTSLYIGKNCTPALHHVFSHDHIYFHYGLQSLQDSLVGFFFFFALFPLQCGQCMGGACVCFVFVAQNERKVPMKKFWLTDDGICIMWLFVTVWYRCQISSLFSIITSCCNSSLIMFL